MSVSEDFHSAGKEEESEQIRPEKPGWEQTTANPEADKQKQAGYLLSDKPRTLDLDDPDKHKNPFNEESGANDYNFISNTITLRRKNGQPPSPKQLEKAVKRALDQGWTTMYVFESNGKKPDLQMAGYIQQFITQNKLGDKINCCLDEKAYKEKNSIKKIQKDSKENGATRKRNVTF